MKTEALDKCLDFILNWQFLSIEDHHQLFLKGDMFGESHIEPLRRELIENLIMLDHQQQVNVISFYVNELNRVAITDFFKSFEKREASDEKRNRLRTIHPTPGYKFDDPFFVGIYHLHLLLFMEIEKICKIYNIPLTGILKDQGIDLNSLFIDEPERLPENKAEQNLPSIRPTFLPEFIPQVFHILKDFFSRTDQPVLLKLLETGGNSEKRLLFIDNGSRLADSFKQLFDCGIVIGCQKKEFEDWICKNFHYRYRNVVKAFTKRYIADIISSSKDKCQKPILNVKQEKTTGRFFITKV
jgi:hypothetical protein